MADWLDKPVAGPYSVRGLARGLRDAVAGPMQQDIVQGNRAIKAAREQYPTVDNLAGTHPAVAAAQVANDVIANQTDGGTALNVLQAAPMLKQVNMLHKGLRVGGYGIDSAATAKKNLYLTAGQVLAQPSNAE